MKKLQSENIDKLVKWIPVVLALVVGLYAGHSFTKDRYEMLETSNAKYDSTAICRLELRENSIEDEPQRYSALLEYRDTEGGKEFCEEHTPTRYLPSSTRGASFDSLQSEEDYKESQ